MALWEMEGVRAHEVYTGKMICRGDGGADVRGISMKAAWLCRVAKTGNSRVQMIGTSLKLAANG